MSEIQSVEHPILLSENDELNSNNNNENNNMLSDVSTSTLTTPEETSLSCSFKKCSLQEKITLFFQVLEEMALCVSCATNEAIDKAIDKAISLDIPEKCRLRARKTAQCAHHAVKNTVQYIAMQRIQTSDFFAQQSHQTGEFLVEQKQRLSKSDFAKNMKTLAEDVKRSVNDLLDRIAAMKLQNKFKRSARNNDHAEQNASATLQDQWDLIGSPIDDVVPLEDGTLLHESPAVTAELLEDDEMVMVDAIEVDHQWDIVPSNGEEDDVIVVDQEEISNQHILEDSSAKETPYTGIFAEEVQIIRGILNDVEIEKIVQLLQQCQGSVQMTLNELMDM